MKKLRIKYILVFAMLLAYFSCRDESTIPYPDINDYVGAVTNVETNPDKTFFNALNDLATEEVEFTIDVNGFEITEINTVDLELVFTQAGILEDLEGNPRDSVWAPVLFTTLNTFPSTVNITGQQTANILGFEVEDFAVGDSFILTFPINTADGRRLTVALNSDLCNEPVQPSFGGCSFQWGVSCPSDLAGEYTLEIVSSNIDLDDFAPILDGEVTELAAGFYKINDGTMDIFGPDFPIGLKFFEICGEISIVPESIEFPDNVIFDNNGSTYDQNTGVITFSLVYNNASCCGLPGIEYVFTATPK